MGGEKLDSDDPDVQSLGSPPRGRGKDVLPCGKVNSSRITPAWAGKSLLYSLMPPRMGDHPRMGGEKSFAATPGTSTTGSPPHGRGKNRHLSHGLLPCG